MGASISCITVAGVDHTVDPKELAELRRANPQVEWGVMWHPEQEGRPLHPDRSWINRLFKQCPEGQKSLHLSGQGIDRFVAGDGDVLEMAQRFNRLVLHCNPYTMAFEAQDIDRAIRDHGRPVITPQNELTRDMNAAIKAPNHLVLFDAAEGQDRLPNEWLPPLQGKKCGYFGGLNAENIHWQVPAILKAAEGNRVWIQVVDGARDGHNQFDTHRTQQLLRGVARLSK